MAKYIMKKLQRGPTLKLNFSVMTSTRPKSDNNVIETELINVDNLALVVMTFKGNNGNLQLGIKKKKTEHAKNLTVPMTVATGIFKDQFICSNEWVETQVAVKSFDSSINPCYNIYNNNNQEVFLHNFEVHITIQTVTPMPIVSMVTRQQYEDTEFTDFELAAPDGTVPVHKSVLVIHSDMLRTMLRCGDWKESKEGLINVSGVTKNTLLQLKSYMYLGVLPDESMDLGMLLLIASYYLMEWLKADCIAKVVKAVRPKDIEGLIEFACENKMPDLIKTILFQTPDDILTNAYKLDTVKKNVKK